MGKKLYVGNLAYSITNETLTELFTEVGTVESAKIIIDPMSGRSKGFGFVEMSSDEEAQSAITTLNTKPIDGRALTVSEARPQTSSGGSRGGFRSSGSDSRPSGGFGSSGFGGRSARRF